MIEERLTPEAVVALEAKARKMMVESAALAGLIESECRDPSLFVPMVTKGLRAVHIGDGDVRVLAVDSNGEIRRGPLGPMTAVDLANELKHEEAYREIGWPRSQPQTPGKTTGGRALQWQ